ERPHSSSYNSITEAVIGFVQLARQEGWLAGVQETQEALIAAACGTLDESDSFKYALKAIFCTNKEESERFGPFFDRFWGKRKGAIKSRMTYKNQSNLQRKSPGSLVWMGQGKSEEEGKEEGKNVSGANKIERLRQTDFSKIEEMDSALLEELALQLWKQMSLRMKRKLKASANQGRIDLRQTIRASIGYGGDPLDLRRKKRAPRRQRLTILLDVSGSMDKYSFFLLRFIWALRAHFEQVEAFIFSTNLVRITDYLDSKDLERTLSLLTARAHNWSSGTKIGWCLQQFNEQYAKQVLSGSSTTIVLSDGLDTGEPELLAEELTKIKQRTRRLIWLNPLKGMRGYEPTAKGMSAALPEIDVFNSAHNLNSLLELEKYLSYV
ncbi:MAG: VWA domain-containing protein, partial [Phaeodactylibacter sp.]|nr:VWA domain-containing protein [Phaeodactylibacter sp.]